MKKMLSLLIAVTASWASAATADTFPARPVTLVVPFAPGGPTDSVARITADALRKVLKTSVLVENAAGAGGTIGTQRVIRAQPDGYTVLLHHLGLATSLALYRNLPFDPRKDLLPVGVVSDASMTIMARPNYEPNTLAEVVADAKKRKQALTFAHSGLGAASQLCGMLFQAAIQTQLTNVPYRGGGPVIQALLGNQVDLGCEQATTSAPLVQAKRLKPYAVTSSRRLSALPDVPTAAEAGLDKFEISVWHGLYVPAGTPPDVVQTLSRALEVSLKDPELVKRFNDISTDATPAKANPKALQTTLHSEIERWSPLIKAAGQYAD